MGRNQTKKTMIRECKTHSKTTFAFYTYSGGSIRRWSCLKCSNERSVKRHRDKKQRAVKVLGGKCAICDYNSYTGALEFHHIDPKTKIFSLYSGNLGRPWTQVLAEIEKCALLCSNCHKEVHAGVALLPDRQQGEVIKGSD